MTAVRAQRSTFRTIGLLLILLAVGGALRLNGLASIGLIGDEFEDLVFLQEVASTPNPFSPLPHEKLLAWDQTLLPFYLTGIVYRLSGREGVHTARFVSVACALLALIALFALGTALFDARIGLIACALQAVSIYDIGFSRFGLTTSSSLFVAGFLLSLLILFKATQTGRLRWYWLAGIAIGVSMGAKLFGIFSLGITGVWLLSSSRTNSHRCNPIPRTAEVRFLLAANVVCMLVFTVLALMPSQQSALKLPIYGTAVTVILLLHAAGLRRAQGTLDEERPAAVALVISTFAALYFFISSPSHLDIGRLLAVMNVFDKWHNPIYGNTTPWDFITVLFVRLNVPCNLLWVGALVHSMRRRRSPPHRVLLLAFGIPFVFLSLVEFKVTWYLMMVFPICYLMIAVLLVDGWRWLRGRRRLRAMVVGTLALSSVWYGVQMASLHPYYEIDGYRLGRSFIGWNRPAFVTFERLPEAVAWIDAHLPDGAQVACVLIGAPKYNRYAYYHVRRAQRNQRISYHLAYSAQEASGAPYVFTSLYSGDAQTALESSGYRRIRTFWLKDIEYAALYADSG